MSETVSVDGKGRLVLPKKVREKARIGVNIKLIATASGVGKVELSDPAVVIAKAQEMGAKKLVGWIEEEHKASTYLLKTMGRAKDEDDGLDCDNYRQKNRGSGTDRLVKGATSRGVAYFPSSSSRRLSHPDLCEIRSATHPTSKESIGFLRWMVSQKISRTTTMMTSYSTSPSST